MTNYFKTVPDIEESLRSLCVHESTTRPEGALLLKGGLGRIDGPVEVSVPELWLRNTGPLSVEALVRVVVRALRDVQHDSSERVAGFVLAVYAVNVASEHRCADGLHAFLQEIVDVTAEVHFVIPALQDVTANFVIGSFQFERTDWHRLQDLCLRIGCDYASKYRKDLEGTQTIRSSLVPCRLIAKAVLREKTALRYRVYDDYMAVIAEGIRAAVVRAYSEETALLTICSEWMFPLDRLVRHSPITSITIFRERVHRNSRGWVVPTRSAVAFIQSSDFWPAGAATASEWRKSGLGGMSPRDDLPTWLHGACRLVLSAIVHRSCEELDLAGLIATTAIELILCESGQELQKTVCELGACICRRGELGASHLDESRIKQLYTARSKFVHAGEPICLADAADLVLLSRTVVKVAAQAAAVVARPRLIDRIEWLSKLKAIRASEAAEFPVHFDQLKSAGFGV